MHENAVKLEYPIESYNELVHRLSAACSYNLNSRGFQLLEDAAQAVTVAIERLTELEQFINHAKTETDPVLNKIEQSECSNVFRCSFLFTIHKNVAEKQIIDALYKEGLKDVELVEFRNQVNFAHGILASNDEKSFQIITSKQLYVGDSILIITPCTVKDQKVDSKTNKRKRKSVQSNGKEVKK